MKFDSKESKELVIVISKKKKIESDNFFLPQLHIT